MELTQLCLERYGNVCHLCGRPGATTSDHIIPRSLGGDDSIDNLRPAHMRCNSARGNMTLNEWRRRFPIDMTRRARPSRRW